MFHRSSSVFIFRTTMTNDKSGHRQIWHVPSAGEFYALAAKLAAIGVGGISLVLATALISPLLLGYYYSFLSIAVWRTAADGGMSYLIVRFAAHEWGHIESGIDPAVAEARLASLVRMIIPVYFGIAVLFGVGAYFLGSYWLVSGALPRSTWQPPLIALSFVMGLNMAALPVRALVEGINDIVASNRGTLFSSIAGIAGFSSMLFLHQVLYAVPLWFLISAIVSFAIWLPALKPVWKICRRATSVARISWRDEFWPLQWRLILSSMAGLALFQLFVPIAFKILGPVSAGRIGMVLQVQQAIDQLGSVWVQARTPAMAILAARRKFGELRDLARRTSIYSIASASATALLVFIGYLILRIYFPGYSVKLTTPLTAFMFFLTSVLLQPAHVETAVVRCQKLEPFVVPTIVTGALMILMTAGMAKIWGEAGIAAAFLICNGGILMPVTLWISARATPGEDR